MGDLFSVEHNKLKEELEELKEKCAELEQFGTPRPKWDMCAEFIGGGITRWKLITDGLSSREQLEVILKELGPTSRENLEYFDGLVRLIKWIITIINYLV
jgi:hypothetical protein